jgi:hypothetical protein
MYPHRAGKRNRQRTKSWPRENPKSGAQGCGARCRRGGSPGPRGVSGTALDRPSQRRERQPERRSSHAWPIRRCGERCPHRDRPDAREGICGGGHDGQSKANRLQRRRHAGRAAGQRYLNFNAGAPEPPTGPDQWVTIRANPADGQACSSGVGLGRFKAPQALPTSSPRSD